jgi:ComF family protein
MVFNSLLIKHSIREVFLKPLLHLFFPYRCHACSIELFSNESILCIFCETGLEHTFNQAELPQYLVSESITLHSLCYYSKGHAAQPLLHALKYKHERNACFDWGVILAKNLKAHSIEMPEYLIPVPLHPQKEYLRGYNQSEYLARGIQAVFPSAQLRLDLIKRVKNSNSQTRKNRHKRLHDVRNVFELNAHAWGTVSHIGLVDDVITTGATLKGIIELIKTKYPDIRITIFVLAVTK